MEKDIQALRKITVNGRQIILLGTAHVSAESIKEVKEVISGEKPDTVCVELDSDRYKTLTDTKSWQEIDIIKVIKEGKGFLLLANLALSSFQKKMGLELGTKPGDEMKAAIEISSGLGIKTAMVDRPIQITLKRAWAKSGFTGKSKLLAALLGSSFSSEKLTEEEIEQLKNRSAMDGMMDEISRYLPSVKEVLIDERDRYLASKIWEAGGEKTVAVLGAGHLKGTEQFLIQLSKGEKNTDVSEIEVIPPKSRLKKAAGFILPALILCLIAAGFFKGGLSKTSSMLISYTLWNGGLAALGALIALGNPLAILTGFIAAPITSINPFIGVGFFTGIVQAWIKKPQVKDMENLSGDACSLKGWYKNRITRTLLVFMLSSIGSSIGTFITVPALFSNLMR